MSDEPESFEQFVERVNKLPEKEKREAINRLSLTWDLDWDIIYKFIYIHYEKKTYEECEDLRKDYIAKCTKDLMDAFGYAGIFGMTVQVDPKVWKELGKTKF